MKYDTAIKKNKITTRKVAHYIVSYILLILFALIFIFPIYCLLLQSVMPDHQLLEIPSLWPESLNFMPYLKVFTLEYLWYFKNTLFICLMNILGVCLIGSLSAYGLAKVHFKGKEILFAVILATVMLPGTVTSIPLYVLYTRLHMTDTSLPLWLPIWFGGGAMNIFLMRQFIKGIPNSYSEAALIDGANSFKIYYSIILPLLKPIIIYLAIQTFMTCWNDFQGPMMYLRNDQSSWTISLALYRNFQNLNSGTNKPNVQMAAGIIMMLPCVLLFAFFQKQLMEGVSTIGIKG